MAVYVLVGLAALIFFVNLSGGGRVNNEIPISQVVSDIKDKKVDKLALENDRISVKYKDNKTAVSRKESGESIYQVLKNSDIDPKSVTIEVKDTSWSQAWLSILGTLLPVLLMVGVFFLIFRQAREAGQSIFAFGQSRARVFSKDSPQIKFSDVAGVEEAKKELEEVVDFLKSPQKYKDIGARIPKGVLLVGPPGCGKTLLARAVSGEAGVPFFSIAGSEFMEMLVGVGASRVRDLFSQAKKSAPAIIFVDEIESIGRMRGFGISGGHDEREQTLNQILVEMDGFTPNDHVMVLGASVTGDTPILIREGKKTQLLPISEFVDSFYQPGEEGIEKEVVGIEALGFDKKHYPSNLHKNNLYFGSSAFKNIRGVFRHKVSAVYEVTYLGGKIRATGNHSVFVRNTQGIMAKPVSNLQRGDILVDLPFKANRSSKAKREIRAHAFPKELELLLPLRKYSASDQLLQTNYQFVLDQKNIISQQSIASQIGVSQTTVGNWQNEKYLPRALSGRYYQSVVPSKVKVTPDFCRLLGFYTAEGYARKGIDFCFNRNEYDLQEDVILLMEKFFGVRPSKIRSATNNAVNIIYNISQLSPFFISLCGKGAHNKHIPMFLCEAPREYFLEYLKSLIEGDGHITKQGEVEITSVSRQLILELSWLCSMHGIKASMHQFTAKEGRRINSGKPLPETQAYRLQIGSHSNPFRVNKTLNYSPFPRVVDIKRVPFNDFVYDLCGMDNEAFFGGKSPILLHNTNRPDLLDPALIRPGRFDRRVVLNMPDLEERRAIIQLHMKGKPFTKDVETERLARRTVGFSGADLANMLNEAAILAAREGKKAIDAKDLEEAATKVKLGPQRKRMQTEEDRKLSAYHEAGHAVVGHNLPQVDPVHRISIVSRGMTGGHTMFPPTEDRSNERKSRLLEQITTALGGRAAEEMVFGDISTGAANDLEVATEIAREMVTEYGMSDLGPINIKPHATFGLWGRIGEEGSGVSESMQTKIDEEIKRIIDNAHYQAQQILKKNKAKLDKVAKALLEKETLDTDEFESIVGKKKSS